MATTTDNPADDAAVRPHWDESPASTPRVVELVFEPLEEGGYHVYAPDLPGLHTQGEDIDDATRNAEEALALYVERRQS